MRNLKLLLILSLLLVPSWLFAGGPQAFHSTQVVADYLDMSILEADPGYREGRVFWDSANHTLGVYPETNGPVLQVGQESWVRVFNTGALIPDGAAVTITSALAGVVPVATLAKANATSTSMVMGLATHDIPTGSFGYITTLGVVRDFNTVAWPAGSNLFLSAVTAGSYSTDLPGDSNYTVRIGKVISSAVKGAIFVNPIMPCDLFPAKLKWQDLRVSLLSTNAAGSNPPGLSKILATGSSQGVFAYAFDRLSEEELYTSVQLPHGFYKGTLEPHVHWQSTDTSVATVTWGLEYVIQNINAVGSPATEIHRVSQVSSGVARKHQLAAFDHIHIENVKDSAIILVRFFRDATNASDTYNTDAIATDLDFHYQTDTLGSILEYGDN